MPDTLISTETLSNRRPPKAGHGKTVRELWNACQERWKDIAAASKACDAAMLSGSEEAEQEADRHMEVVSDAFAKASDDFLAVPARTVDDAACKLLYVLQQGALRDEHADELRKVLRVLQKLN
jgi:L-serine deaminase